MTIQSHSWPHYYHIVCQHFTRKMTNNFWNWLGKIINAPISPLHSTAVKTKIIVSTHLRYWKSDKTVTLFGLETCKITWQREHIPYKCHKNCPSVVKDREYLGITWECLEELRRLHLTGAPASYIGICGSSWCFILPRSLFKRPMPYMVK